MTPSETAVTLTGQTTEVLPDDAPLRTARRRRVLAEMERADVDILVIGREANARYVAGVRRLWTAGSRAFGPGCVLIRESGAIHLLSTWDEGVPDDIPREHLYGISFNSQTFLRVLSELDGASTARTVATDGLTRSAAGMLAKAFPNATVVDGEQLLRRARSSKLPDEIDAIRASIGIAERALDKTLGALVPGVTERQLTAVFMEAMAAQGVTTPATQDVAWITSRDQPWQRSSRDTPVAVGDLVAFDAAVISHGYFGELSRTIVVGELGDDGRALFRRRDELLDRLLTACVPGAPTSDLLDAYAAAGVEAPPMPVARGLGHGFDMPLVSHALPETAAAERLEPGMVLGLSAFVWEVGLGAAYAQQPVVIDDHGAVPLAAHTLDPCPSAQIHLVPVEETEP
jgi:Xaa-Pro dipeptidase